MNKVIGLFAHVDAGKTTFAEQILYHSNSIRQRGRVDRGNSFLDSHEIEKKRGITVFSNQAVFKVGDSTYYLIDTPGHSDFSPDMERNMDVIDYAVLLVSAADGIEAQTEVIWRLLRQKNIPTFIFINKMDRHKNSIREIKDNIRENLTEDFYVFGDEDIVSKRLMEFMAERDEEFLDLYIDEDYREDVWFHGLLNMIKKCNIFPCMYGSALLDLGIENFIKKLHCLTYTNYSKKGKFSGIVYKVRFDSFKNKISYIKVTGGSLQLRDEVIVHVKNTGDFNEKICGIDICSGDKYINLKTADAGMLCAVKGLSKSSAGCFLGNFNGSFTQDLVPLLKSKVIFDKDLDPKWVLECFQILSEEEPSLDVSWNENLQSIEMSLMGKIQLEVLQEIVLKRFNISVEFGPSSILYKETIVGGAEGYGHFEPLRHYAEIYIEVQEAERNSGISFQSMCKIERLDTRYQNLIEKFTREGLRGKLTASPVTDVKIVLRDGRSHIKHTSGGDFREAFSRAFANALEKATCALLEPYYSFKIRADVDFMGKILSDIERLNGEFETPDISNGIVYLKGKGPAECFMDYPAEFMSFTGGRGFISFDFDGYYSCHNQDEVIEKIGYNKDQDERFNEDSIFCSKGQAFVVEGKKVKEYMHCFKK